MPGHVSRREALLLGTPLVMKPAAHLSKDAIRARLPRDVPSGVAAIIANTLNDKPQKLNTDWFGTFLMEGLLRWFERGIREVRPFAVAWLDHHLAASNVARYSGARGRTVFAGGIPITTYAGHFGLAFPCYEMARQLEEPRAARICRAVAEIVLHKTARNRLGMVEHDDSGEFAIPDTCFFAIRALMDAYDLNPENGGAFRTQAVFQLRTYIDTFLISDTGLAKTVLRSGKLGETYWTRASGWLLWAITATLRHLPSSDPEYEGFLQDLERLVHGISRVQHDTGGFRVLLNDESTPIETTGTAMFASGVSEAIRRGWLSDSYTPNARRAWDFVKRNIIESGEIRNAYTGWAVPAEQRRITELMDHRKMGWVQGLVLRTADELTRLRSG